MSDSNIKSKLSQKGWTPGRKEIIGLVEEIPTLSEDLQEKACRLVSIIDKQALYKLNLGWSSLELKPRQIAARFLGLAVFKNLSSDPNDADVLKTFDWYLSLVQSEADFRIKKGLVQAAGVGLESSNLEQKSKITSALLQVATSKIDAVVAKPLILALGKSQDARAKEVIKSLKETYQVVDHKSELILSRDLTRGSAASLSLVSAEVLVKNLLQTSKEPLNLVFSYIQGLEKLAQKSYEFSLAETLSPGVLSLSFQEFSAGEQEAVFLKLLNHRLWKSFSIVLSYYKSKTKPTPEDLVAVIKANEKMLINGAKEDSTIRIRLGRTFGYSRQAIWQFAEDLSKASTKVISDGREAHWDLELIQKPDQSWYIAVAPQNYQDLRWSWRDEAVEGSSQGTLAAAIAMLADVKPKDKVWDPFCGAGTELLEVFLRSKKDHTIQLIGTDIMNDSLQFAEKSAKALGAKLDLRCLSALEMKERFDVILTNPPFGMRTARGEARGLMEEFFYKVKSHLNKSGRLILVSHAPRSTFIWGQEAGLALVNALPIDLDGLGCELQRFEIV